MSMSRTTQLSIPCLGLLAFLGFSVRSSVSLLVAHARRALLSGRGSRTLDKGQERLFVTVPRGARKAAGTKAEGGGRRRGRPSPPPQGPKGDQLDRSSTQLNSVSFMLGCPIHNFHSLNTSLVPEFDCWQVVSPSKLEPVIVGKVRRK